MALAVIHHTFTPFIQRGTYLRNSLVHKHPHFLPALLATYVSVGGVNVSSQDSEESLKSSFTTLKAEW